MRYPHINNTLFKNNRRCLAQQLEPGSVALLFSGGQMPRNGDQYYFPYRQNSDLLYLTGIEQEKTILLLAPHTPDTAYREVLFIIRSTPKIEIWEGEKLTPEQAAHISGINTVVYTDEFNGILESVLRIAERVYLNIDMEHTGERTVPSEDAEWAGRIRQLYPTHIQISLKPILQQLRLIKSDTEIGLLRSAVEITRQTFLSVLSAIKPGKKEYEIEALIGYEFIRQGAAGHAYAPIVASGSNACILHYIANNDELLWGNLVLMDFGAEYANYAADLSRTVPINGKYTKRQRELYDSLLRTFHFARSLMKPGITINQLHAKVGEFVEAEHMKIGLYNTRDISNHEGEKPLWHRYYMHGTSHFLGLDVHDVGTKDIELQPGMVITCEPGIYIPEEGIGIRTENDILITNDGNEDLMIGIPVEAEEIEDLMNGK